MTTLEDEMFDPIEVNFGKTKKRSKPLKVISILLVIIMACFISGYFFMIKQNETAIEDQQTDIMSVEHLPKIGASVAFGDSTMSLSDGVRSRPQGCLQEENNWVERLPDVVNMSCPGADINKTISIIKKSNSLKENPASVLVTVGTNTLRQRGMDTNIEKYLQYVVDNIRSVSPDTKIIFVGYLKVFWDAYCIEPQYKETAKTTDELHTKANEALKDVAKKNNIVYADMSDLKYNICDPNTTYVRLPNTTKGANWHTTSVGHNAVATKLSRMFPDEFPKLDPMKDAKN